MQRKKLQSVIYKSQIQQVGIQKMKSENQNAQARTPKQIHMRHFKKKNQKHAGESSFVHFVYIL